jgi:hypothetical protein
MMGLVTKSVGGGGEDLSGRGGKDFSGVGEA